MMPLRFEPIDLKRTSALCVEFRRDSFVASFGDASRFENECGPQGERYVAWLEQKLAADPRSCLHVWLNDTIVGQLELGTRDDGLEEIGYVHLIYVVPQLRSTGVAEQLQAYVDQTMRAKGAKRIQLRCSPTNTRALAHYSKHGWRDLGPDQREQSVHVFEKDLPPSRGT